MSIPNNSNTYLPGVIFIPSSLTITAISNSFPMVITIDIDPVTEANTYQEKMLVRLFIPYDYGMFQANGLVGEILEISGNNISVAIDSTNFDPFVIPTDGNQPASLSPSGSRNLQFNNFTKNVPFQPLNNIGN